MRDTPDNSEFAEPLRDEQLRQFFNLSVIGAVVIGRDDTYERVNRSFCEMLGYEEDELVGQSPLKFTHPDDVEKTANLIATISHNNGDSFESQKRYCAKDGSTIWVQVTANALRESDGALLYYVAQIQDITDRKLAEDALQESEARHDRSIAGSSDGLWERNIQTGDEHWSPRWMEIIGYRPDELPSTAETYRSLLHPDDVETVETAIQAHITTGAPYEREVRMRHKSGHYVWIKTRAKVFFDDDGEPLYLAGSHTNLTDEKRAEAEAHELEQRYQTLFENAKDGIVVHVDEEPVVLDCNQNFAENLGYRREELIGQPIFLFTGKLSPELRAKRRENIDIEHNSSFEATHVRKDGTPLPVEITSSQIVLNGRKAVMSIVRDVTERREAEAALLASEQRFKEFAETSADRLWETDVDFRYTFVTEIPPGTGRLSSSDMIGITSWEAPGIDPTDDNWVQLRSTVAARLPIQNFEYSRELTDGRKYWIRTNAQPIYDDDNEFLGYRGTNLNVTAEIEARMAAKTAEQVFIESMNSLDAGFILWDQDDRFLASSQNSQTYRSESAQSLVHGTPIREFLVRLFNSNEINIGGLSESKFIDLYMEEHAQPHSVKEVKMLDGHWQRIQKRKLPNGCSISFQFDITELKQRQEQAESADRAKSLFLASASHDLRQPLQALGLNIYRLKIMDPDPDRREIISKVQSTLDMLDGLLASLLDLSNLEAGQLQPEMIDTPLSQILQQLGDDFEPIVAINSNQLRIVQSDLIAHTDPVLLKTVLQNLIANANKFTSKGRILMGCRRRGANIRIEVWDTGRGISEGNVKRIFDEFYQIDNQARDSSQGLGLGLSIVQRVTKMLGHPVEVRSELGRGSVFAVEVPLGTIPEVTMDPDSAETQDSGNALIVIVDDNPTILEPLELILDDVGYDVQTCAYTGPDCPEFMGLETACNRTPDLIISDLRLPGELDGIGVIDNLRQRFGQTVPAVLITGDSSHDTVIQAKESELQLLHKPVAVPKLCAVISEMLN